MTQKVEESVGEHAKGLAPLLENFVAIQILLALACMFSEVCCTAKHFGPPFDYPLKTREQKALDLLNYQEAFRHFHSPAFFTFTPHYLYPAPVAPMYWIFLRYHAHPAKVLVGFILGTFLIWGLLVGKALWRRGAPFPSALFFIAVSLPLGFPLWFEIRQANMEIGVWVFVACGVFAFLRNRNYTAATLFGIAGSMKLFPFVYLGLLLSKRKYREIALSVAVAACSTIASLWLVGGRDILNTWHQIQSGLAEFRTVYMLHFRPSEIGFDHSLFAVYKRLAPNLPPPSVLSHFLTLYLAVAAISGIALYFLRIRHLPVINQVLCLCIASILLPPVSYEYTLMHLYVPFGLLALFAQEKWIARERIPGLNAAIICFAVLLSPLSELIYHSERFGGQIKAIVLVVLMVIGLKYPFQSAEAFDAAPVNDAPTTYAPVR